MPRYYFKQQGKNTALQNGRPEKSKPFFVFLSVNFRETKFNRDRICCPPLWSTTFVSLIWQTMYFRSLLFSTREIKCVYLPGHLETFGLHSSVSVSFPSLEQSLPPFAGFGLSHSLSRLLVPFLLPQVTEHSLHFPHWPYPPSTAKYTQQVFNHAQYSSFQWGFIIPNPKQSQQPIIGREMSPGANENSK